MLPMKSVSKLTAETERERHLQAGEAGHAAGAPEARHQPVAAHRRAVRQEACTPAKPALSLGHEKLKGCDKLMSLIKGTKGTVLKQDVSTLDDSSCPADVLLQFCWWRVRRGGGRHPQRCWRTLLVALPRARPSERVSAL